MKKSKRAGLAAVLGVLAVGAVTASAVIVSDFGVSRDAKLASESEDLFGIAKPLAASSLTSIDLATAQASPEKLATLAKGLKAKVITAGVAAPNIDQMALWPNGSKPTHLIACNEQGTTDPGVQRISIATGAVETIVTGTSACDGVRRTAWGTILFSEEAGSGGQTYELIDPLATTGVNLDRATGAFSGGTGSANLVRRTAVGRLSFEGHGLLSSGVMYYGDELRPATGAAGGAYFKFVPAIPFAGSAPITSLADSPLASGKIFGLRLGLNGGATDYGQGTQSGRGVWVSICADGSATPCNNVALRTAGVTNKLTGYYRPEDLEVSPVDLAAGTVKVCGNNTGNEFNDHYWGETVCITDGTVAQSLAGTAVPEVQNLVNSSIDMAMTDNIAPQPGRAGRWLIAEDGDVGFGGSITPGKNNDMFLCLPDGADVDDQSDGCIKVATLNDAGTAAHPEGAEWTGPIFSDDGKHMFVSVQHNITGKGVVLDITGWNGD
jgi:secreted PhoX family phosphatase